MEWTEKQEHKKKIRKMAYRMLWADFKDLVCGWRVLLLALMYLGFFFLPYYKASEQFNAYGTYYFCIWVLMSLSALSENSFNYLPLSTKDIVYYLKCRTNHMVAWMILISVLSGIMFDAFGVEVFFERGLMVLLFLLITVEWYYFMALYGYSKPFGVNFLDDSIPTARKVRIVIYNVYSVGTLFGTMLVSMFMDYNEHAKTKLLVVLCLYLVMYIFRADATRWVRFNEYNKMPRRGIYATSPEQMNKQN